MLLAPFAPLTSSLGLVATANLAATAVAANVTLPTVTNARPNQIRIENHATDWAYMNFGTLAQCNGTPATVATSMGVAPGAVEVLTIDPSATTASVILGSGTGTVRFTVGEGV